MPVPFEALLPYGIMVVLFSVSGYGVAKLQWLDNGQKRPRYNLGTWDLNMMDRDRRLTGYSRGQQDKVEAQPGFEVNNPWKAEFRFGGKPR